jgi:hypothetical protein
MGPGGPFPGKIFIIASFQHHRFKVGSHSLGESGLTVSEILHPGGQVFQSLDRTQSNPFEFLLHESLKKIDLASWCFGTVLINLTTFQMIRLTWGTSQVPANARNRSSPYPIWGLKYIIGPFQPPQISCLLSRLRTPLGRYLGGQIGISPLLAKVALSA